MTSHSEPATPRRQPRARTRPARRPSSALSANATSTHRRTGNGSCATPCSPERNAGIRPISTLVGRCRCSTSTVMDSSPRAKRTPTLRSTGVPSGCPPSTRTTARRCSSRSTPRRSAAGSARAGKRQRNALGDITLEVEHESTATQEPDRRPMSIGFHIVHSVAPEGDEPAYERRHRGGAGDPSKPANGGSSVGKRNHPGSAGRGAAVKCLREGLRTARRWSTCSARGGG